MDALSFLFDFVNQQLLLLLLSRKRCGCDSTNWQNRSYLPLLLVLLLLLLLLLQLLELTRSLMYYYYYYYYYYYHHHYYYYYHHHQCHIRSSSSSSSNSSCSSSSSSSTRNPLIDNRESSTACPPQIKRESDQSFSVSLTKVLPGTITLIDGAPVWKARGPGSTGRLPRQSDCTVLLHTARPPRWPCGKAFAVRAADTGIQPRSFVFES